MEIPAWQFFSFWCIISIAFMHLGFHALDKTPSAPRVLISLLKHSLAISSCTASNYALIFRPRSTDDTVGLHMWACLQSLWVLNFKTMLQFQMVPLVGGIILYISTTFSAWILRFPILKFFSDNYSFLLLIFLSPSTTCSYNHFLIIPIMTLINFTSLTSHYKYIPEMKPRLAAAMASHASLFYVTGGDVYFFPLLVLVISLYTSAFWVVFVVFEPPEAPRSYDELIFRELAAVADAVDEIVERVKGKKMGKFMGFVVGVMGSILFQYFFKLTTFHEVAAFLYLAVMWAANMVMLGVSDDLEVYNFVLGNVVVGCTVNSYGLRGTTWFAYGTSLLLYWLRLKLEGLTLVYGQGERIVLKLGSESPYLPLPI